MKIIYSFLCIIIFSTPSFSQLNRDIGMICARCEGGGGSGGGGLPAIQCTGNRDTVYVDNVNGSNFSNQGRSWADAVKTLQRGLAIANTCATVTTILVAKGTYTASTTSGTAEARDFSFIVGRSVAIMGGFPTGGGTRNYITNPTVLDGEIQDLYEAHHVMVIYGTTGQVAIDGFQIKNGFADGTGSVELQTGVNMPRNVGAAMYIRDAANIKIRNCTFYNNVASDKGGALYIIGSNVNIENCVFVNNTCGTDGGGIYGGQTSTLNISSSTFYNNLAFTGGQSVYMTAGSTINAKNSIIWGGSTALAGGSTKTISHCLLQNGNMNDSCVTGNPQFNNTADPDGADNTWFTQDDGLNLRTCSPALNRGSNILGNNNLLKDITLTNRPTNQQVDMGAYEKNLAPAQITSLTELSANNDFSDNYLYAGSTPLNVQNNCRIIAGILPMNNNGSVGRIKAKTYVDATNLSYNGIPLVNRHYNIDETEAEPNGENTVTLYFSNADFTNFNARADALVKLPGTTAANPQHFIKVLQFAGNSATGTPESYGVAPVEINPGSVQWDATASVWKVFIHSNAGLGGYFITSKQTFEFTGTGNWSLNSNWVNNSKPPSTLPKYSKIIVRENADCLLNTSQTIAAGASMDVEYGASFTANNLLEIEGDLIIEKNKKIFTTTSLFVVPPGVTSLQVAMWGAGGYGGNFIGGGGGGNGGFVAGTLNVSPGETLNIIVAGSTQGNQNAQYSLIGIGGVVPLVNRLLLQTFVLAAGGGNGSANAGKGGNAGAVGADGTLGTSASGGAGKGATTSAGGSGGAAGSGGT
ncbi:MAG: hypothetical protein EOP47_12235, partial [Sphingobacteriaceae bacterium]